MLVQIVRQALLVFGRGNEVQPDGIGTAGDRGYILNPSRKDSNRRFDEQRPQCCCQFVETVRLCPKKVSESRRQRMPFPELRLALCACADELDNPDGFEFPEGWEDRSPAEVRTASEFARRERSQGK